MYNVITSQILEIIGLRYDTVSFILTPLFYQSRQIFLGSLFFRSHFADLYFILSFSWTSSSVLLTQLASWRTLLRQDRIFQIYFPIYSSINYKLELEYMILYCLISTLIFGNFHSHDHPMKLLILNLFIFLQLFQSLLKICIGMIPKVAKLLKVDILKS